MNLEQKEILAIVKESKPYEVEEISYSRRFPVLDMIFGVKAYRIMFEEQPLMFVGYNRSHADKLARTLNGAYNLGQINIMMMLEFGGINVC
jgi:hypothetical protein